MKNIIGKATMLLMVMALVAEGKAQVYVREVQEKTEHDVISVNNATSYLLFNHDIYAFGLGDEEKFSGVAYKNSLQIRSRTRREGDRSSVFVVFGDSTYRQYYYAFVEYDENSMNEYYDMRDEFYRGLGSRNTKRLKEYYEKQETENVFLAELKTRSMLLKSFPDDIFNLGTTENHLDLHLRLIRTDNNYAYLKLLFRNNSAVDYNFEKVSFQYVQQFRMGLFKKKNERNVEVYPVVINAPEGVSAYSEEVLVYIIPTFGIKKGEELKITFRERNGGRNLPFVIENNVIMKAQKLENRIK
jgi:hypothetical protein